MFVAQRVRTELKLRAAWSGPGLLSLREYQGHYAIFQLGRNVVLVDLAGDLETARVVADVVLRVANFYLWCGHDRDRTRGLGSMLPHPARRPPRHRGGPRSTGQPAAMPAGAGEPISKLQQATSRGRAPGGPAGIWGRF
jgi:hypothetical protein